jgi:hypothetical protein
MSPRVRGVLVGTGIVVLVALVAGLGLLLWPNQRGPAVLHTGTARYVVTATVDNPRIGSTAIEFTLAARTAGPARAAIVDLEAVMPLMGHATAPIRAVPVGGDRYRADGVALMMPGWWELMVSIQIDGAVEHLTLPLPVSG